MLKSSNKYSIYKGKDQCQEQDEYAGKSSDDDMRNKEQHEGKGRGWACNNHNMHNLIMKRHYRCYGCCM